MLNKSNMSWSCKQVAKMADNGTFVFGNIIQRSYVWEQTRKSELIHSIIEGYPVPPFYAKRVDGKTYDFLDGKQRIEAIRGFIDGEYFLKDVPNVEIVKNNGTTETVSIEGLKFEELPEEIQDAIKDYHLTVYYFENITPEQTRIMFKKLNNGKPLSTKDRNIANCIDIETVSEIGQHEIFKSILTEKGLEGRKHLPMVMKIWEMLNKDLDDVSFASKDFNEVMSTIQIEPTEKDMIIAVLDKFRAGYNAIVSENRDIHMVKLLRKRIGTETNFVSLMPFIKKAIEIGMEDNMLADFFEFAFGDDVVVSEAYAEAAKTNTAKTASIKTRNEELEKKWNEFNGKE